MNVILFCLPNTLFICMCQALVNAFTDHISLNPQSSSLRWKCQGPLLHEKTDLERDVPGLRPVGRDRQTCPPWAFSKVRHAQSSPGMALVMNSLSPSLYS